jgi:hypothetical protein
MASSLARRHPTKDNANTNAMSDIKWRVTTHWTVKREGSGVGKHPAARFVTVAI